MYEAIFLFSMPMTNTISFFQWSGLQPMLFVSFQDIDSIDERIPLSLQDFLLTFTDVIATVIIISVASPWFLIIIIPLSIFYFMIQVELSYTHHTVMKVYI